MRDWQLTMTQLADAVDAVIEADKQCLGNNDPAKQDVFTATAKQLLGIGLNVLGAALYDHERSAAALERIADVLESKSTTEYLGRAFDTPPATTQFELFDSGATFPPPELDAQGKPVCNNVVFHQSGVSLKPNGNLLSCPECGASYQFQ